MICSLASFVWGCLRLLWFVRFSVEVSFPLSSFRTTSYTPESFLEIWQRQKYKSNWVTKPQTRPRFANVIWKAKLFSSAKDAAETRIWHRSKKANRQTNMTWSSILRQNGKTRGGHWPMTTTDNWSQLLVFSGSRRRPTVLWLRGSRAETGHMWHHVYMWYDAGHATVHHAIGQTVEDQTVGWAWGLRSTMKKDRRDRDDVLRTFSTCKCVKCVLKTLLLSTVCVTFSPKSFGRTSRGQSCVGIYIQLYMQTNSIQKYT